MPGSLCCDLPLPCALAVPAPRPPAHPPTVIICQVDGPLSVYCYLSTLDTLYARYSAKWEKRNGRAFRLDDAGGRVPLLLVLLLLLGRLRAGFAPGVSRGASVHARGVRWGGAEARRDACGGEGPCCGGPCCAGGRAAHDDDDLAGPLLSRPRHAYADHALFHAPYNKLVQKAFARLMYHDICK